VPPLPPQAWPVVHARLRGVMGTSIMAPRITPRLVNWPSRKIAIRQLRSSTIGAAHEVPCGAQDAKGAPDMKGAYETLARQGSRAEGHHQAAQVHHMCGSG